MLTVEYVPVYCHRCGTYWGRYSANAYVTRWCDGCNREREWEA